MVKTYNGTIKQSPPDRIFLNGEVITSPVLLANITNKYFIDKIQNIRKSFTWSQVKPLDILSQLIPKNHNNFFLPPITLLETKKIILRLKNSGSTGHDNINNKIIKRLRDDLAPHLMHLINSIIKTSIIPRTFLLSRILPLSKPNKRQEELSSFRPINNLLAIEKIFEEHVSINLQKFLSENNILYRNHHGGRRNYSTTTALLEITNKLNISYDRNHISALLATDLSAAYDTVDSNILLSKLKYYGIDNTELQL